MDDNNNTQHSNFRNPKKTDSLFEHAAIGLAYINLNGRFLHANPAFRKHLGYPKSAIKTLLLDEIILPSDQAKLRTDIDALINRTQDSSTLDLRCFKASGDTCKVRLILSVICNKQDSVLYLIAAIEDISARDDSVYDPLSGRQLFETIAEHVPTTVWLASTDMKRLHYANQAFMDTWKISKEQLALGASFNILDRIHPEDVEKVRQRIQAGFAAGDTWDQSFRIINDDGSISYIDDHGTVLRDQSDEPIYLLGTHNDVSERVRYTSQLEALNQELQTAYEEVTRLNQFDTLTACYNRLAMLDHLSTAYYQFTRYEIPSSIIYIDLNNFKSVNDDYGHNIGDQVLQSFVSSMQKRIRRSDILGRMGGDEFLLLLPGTTRNSAELFLQKESTEFTTSVSPKHKLLLSYSVGVSELDLGMQTIDEWIDAADKMMYQGKKFR